MPIVADGIYYLPLPVTYVFEKIVPFLQLRSSLSKCVVHCLETTVTVSKALVVHSKALIVTSKILNLSNEVVLVGFCMRFVDTDKLSLKASSAGIGPRPVTLQHRGQSSSQTCPFTDRTIDKHLNRGGGRQESVRMINRTFCLACLHSLHAIKETFPALRRLRWLSPPLPLAPPLVPPLVLDSPTNAPCLVWDEPDEWSCWWDGARDRKLDMATFISNIIYQSVVLILKGMNNGLKLASGNLEKRYHVGQGQNLCMVASWSSYSPLGKSQFTKESKWHAMKVSKYVFAGWIHRYLPETYKVLSWLKRRKQPSALQKMRISGVPKTRFIGFEHENLSFIYHPLNHTGGIWLSLVFLSLLIGEFRHQLPDKKWGESGPVRPRASRIFIFLAISLMGVCLVCDLSGFPLIFPIRNLEVRATWTIIRNNHY